MRTLATLYRAELLMVLRDRRTVVLAIVLPIVLTPLMLFAMVSGQEARTRKLDARIFRITVCGGRTREVLDLLAQSAGIPAAERFVLVPCDEPGEAMAAEELDLVIRADDETGTAGHSADASSVPATTLTLLYRADRDVSLAALEPAQEWLQALVTRQRDRLFGERGLTIGVAQLGTVEYRAAGPRPREANLFLGQFLCAMLVFFMFSGGSLVAIDAVAGERERGTLATLLCSAAERHQIAGAKLLLVLTVTAGATLLQLLTLLACLKLKLVPQQARLDLEITLTDVALIALLLLPVAALLSGLLLLLSSRIRRYRDAQFAYLPLLVLVLGAALLPLFPGLSLRSGAVLVPIGNVALAVRDILTGSARALDATLAWVFTAAVAWAVLRLVAAGLHREDLLFGEGAEARPATTGLERLGRDLGLWLAGAWAAFVLVSVYLEGQVGLAMQILVNVVVLFLGGSLVVARIYGVDVIRTFALRRPDWRAWPLVAVGAPASVVLGVGISHLSQTLFPPTADMLDQFEALILESGLGTWQLLLLAAVLPGICEELAFRGLILHAWMTRAPVWRACVLSGVAFALFHLMAFRLATTAVLGTVLAFVTAWTGSLYPAIAWHVLNNAIGLLAGDSGAGAFLAAPPSWAYGAAAVILALALGALRRLRNQAATGG